MIFDTQLDKLLDELADAAFKCSPPDLMPLPPVGGNERIERVKKARTAIHQHVEKMARQIEQRTEERTIRFPRGEGS